MKIALTVDDEPLICEHLRLTLEQHNYTTFSANNIAGAKALLAKISPSIIFLDVEMGNENGFDLCEVIRQHYPQVKCPIIFLTARRSSMDVQEARAAGGDYFLVKPYNEETLLSGIKKAFQIYRARK